MPQSSASSLMVILSRDFMRSSFFKAASNASFVVLVITCPPLFYVLFSVLPRYSLCNSIISSRIRTIVLYILLHRIFIR